MHADELFATIVLFSKDEKSWSSGDLIIPQSWAQGRTAFGGISAGMAYHAISCQVENARLLRSYSVNFIGPLIPDSPFVIEVSSLRTGSNVSQYIAKLIQNNHVCVFVQACFGLARASKIRVNNADRHQMTTPVKAKFIPYIPKVTPAFFRHFELSVAKGGLPFTGQSSPDYSGFMRFKHAPPVINNAHLITLIDAWPPSLLQLLRWPAPASTVSWNLEFLHPSKPVQGDDWFAYEVHTRQAADGYGHTEATIWNSHHDVVALSRQTVAVFD